MTCCTQCKQQCNKIDLDNRTQKCLECFYKGWDKENSYEVTFKYFLPEHQRDLWIHMHAKEILSLICAIDVICKGVIEYEDYISEDKNSLAEHIRDLIAQSINLDV